MEGFEIDGDRLAFSRHFGKQINIGVVGANSMCFVSCSFVFSEVNVHEKCVQSLEN